MDMDQQKARLLARRVEIVGDLSRIEDDLDAPVSKDWEDRASERQGDEVLEALGQNELHELKAIDAALERFEDDSYGICMKCGETISDARLDAIPHAALCRNCAA